MIATTEGVRRVRLEVALAHAIARLTARGDYAGAAALEEFVGPLEAWPPSDGQG